MNILDFINNNVCKINCYFWIIIGVIFLILIISGIIDEYHDDHEDHEGHEDFTISQRFQPKTNEPIFKDPQGTTPSSVKNEQPQSTKSPNNEDELMEMMMEKPVMIFVTAPWCGHCRNLQPVKEEVTNYADNTGDFIVVELVDGEADNMIRSLGGFVEGFPTILAGFKNKIEKFQGSRTKNNLINFMKKNK